MSDTDQQPTEGVAAAPSAGAAAQTSGAGAAVGGIDLGGTKIEAIVADATSYHVLGNARHPTPTTGGPADVANAMAAALTEAARAASLDPAQLRGVGVGSPGTVDPAAGTVARADNLPGWYASFPLAAALHSALGAKVALGNDVGVATNAEFVLGAGKPYRSLLGVFWGTGVGGGLILDGEPWHGRSAAGEIGHTVIVQGGRHCPCGRRGCLEAYAGRAAMEERARKLQGRGANTILFELASEHHRDRLTSGIWERALEHHDKLATKLIDRAVLALGAGIASAVNLLDIEAVIIGGGLGVRFGEPYRERIAAAMQPHLFNDARPPAVHLAGLGDLGGALGAALLVP
ncbi:MAG TPA: ROK family protein [Solirubrobacteraceae bacterium]|nr:ROK family protein [Solirubrobacteraceae bacterium]